MNISCTPETGYFHRPDFLALGSHLNTIISTPVHCFGLFCILFKTPAQMKPVKWNLLNLHIWITCFDYTFGILTIPFMLMPKFVGYPLGVLKYLGISTLCQCFIVAVMFINMLLSILTVYENRFHILCTFSLKPYWTKWRKIVFLIYYVLCVSLLLPISNFVPEQQEESKLRILQTLPCPPSYLYEAPIFVLTEDFTYHLSAEVTVIATTCFAVLFLVIYLIYNGIQQLKTGAMSKKTFDMHKMFFIAIVIQMEVPLVMFVIPLIYALISLLGDYYNQKWTNIAILFISTHGIVATAVMIMVHRPYRDVFLGLFKRRARLSQNHSVRGLQYQNSSIAPIEK